MFSSSMHDGVARRSGTDDLGVRAAPGACLTDPLSFPVLSMYRDAAIDDILQASNTLHTRNRISTVAQALLSFMYADTAAHM